jgi:ATP-dependent DNA ligase
MQTMIYGEEVCAALSKHCRLLRPSNCLLGPLAVGYYEGSKLMFIAKVRNGFTPELRREVAARFKWLESPTCPFANLPEPKNARRGEALTAEAMKAYRWLKPLWWLRLISPIWTDANHLRHSRFVGLRDDKNPKEVVREAGR